MITNKDLLTHKFKELIKKKHGKWEHSMLTTYPAKEVCVCNLCGKVMDGEYFYCPRCGAIMDGK